MQNDRPPPRVAYEKGIRIGGSGWLGRVLAVVVGAVVFVAAAMMSLILLTVLLALGTVAVGYLWWKTRELRKHLRTYGERNYGDDGRTVDVEVVHKDSPEDDSAPR
jgi:hypothetical protein